MREPGRPDPGAGDPGGAGSGVTQPSGPPLPGREGVARHVVRLLSQPVCLLDLTGRVVDGSAVLAERLGESPDALAGRRLEEFVEEDGDAVERALALWQGSSGWRPGGLHIRGGRGDDPGLHCRGARLPGTELLLVEITEHERAVSDFVALNREVELANLRRMESRLQESLRELEAVNQRLESANAELDSYASMVAHDIRTPFNAIGRFTELLLEDHGGELPAGADEMLAAVARLAARGEEVTGALLALARVGDPEFVLDGTDSNEVAARVRSDLAATIVAADGEVVIGDLPQTTVQPVHLERVLTNLLVNALKYTAEDRAPRVVVDGARDGDLARFTVRDNGVGIPESERERIFEPMVRGSAGAAHPGTGVGLATCRKIVEAYGGTINVESQAGEGATVVFTLPVADPPAAPRRG